MTAPAVPAPGTQDPPPARRKQTPRKLLNTFLWYLAAVVLALFIAVPIYLIFVSATTPDANVYDYPKSIVPAGIDTENIQAFVTAAGVVDAFWRSVMAGVVTVVVQFHPTISIDDVGDDRRALAEHCQDVIGDAVAKALSGRLAPRRRRGLGRLKNPRTS